MRNIGHFCQGDRTNIEDPNDSSSLVNYICVDEPKHDCPHMSINIVERRYVGTHTWLPEFSDVSHYDL